MAAGRPQKLRASSEVDVCHGWWLNGRRTSEAEVLLKLEIESWQKSTCDWLLVLIEVLLLSTYLETGATAFSFSVCILIAHFQRRTKNFTSKIISGMKNASFRWNTMSVCFAVMWRVTQASPLRRSTCSRPVVSWFVAFRHDTNDGSFAETKAL